MASADERDGLSTNYLYRLGTSAETAVGKMRPECLKSVSIVRRCKLKTSVAAAQNTIANDERHAFNAPYIHRKIGGSDEKRTSLFHPPSQTKWLALEKGRGPSGREISRMVTLGEVLKRVGIRQ